MTAGEPLILIVEDEAPMRHFVRVSLSGEGYRVAEAGTGQDGLTQATTRNPDLVLLDLGLPDMDGQQVLASLREWTRTPVIVLSARGQESDKVAALDAGADDYLTKPFSVGELMARVRVALRHAVHQGAAGESAVYAVGLLRVDLERHQVWVGDAEVHLTRTEYKLLGVLIQHAGKLVTHRQLLKEVWGPPYANRTEYLRVYMGQLRHKLEQDPARPKYLLTELGVGYRLATDDSLGTQPLKG
jgi:two-component system, OmpR family, KDP operon response regulator KdpE